jgi:hypothetical protein
MKALLTTRSELRWAVVAIPAIFLAHWMLTLISPHLVGLVPESVRTLLHLI